VKGRTDVRVVAQGGDGGTTDIGFGCLSGMFERNDDVLYICYDNEAYMNTGIQRSSATPPAARTATTASVGEAPGNVFGTGKNVPLIAIAHEIPYVATASVANLRDLEYKVTRAMGIRGARYIHIHVPCPLGWGSLPADTIRLARLAVESGLYPLIEAEYGESPVAPRSGTGCRWRSISSGSGASRTSSARGPTWRALRASRQWQTATSQNWA
jgi:pyruvate ferredoxin oxidoreductase beta subunit